MTLLLHGLSTASVLILADQLDPVEAVNLGYLTVNAAIRGGLLPVGRAIVEGLIPVAVAHQCRVAVRQTLPAGRVELAEVHQALRARRIYVTVPRVMTG